MVIVHPEYAELILEINGLREDIANLIVEKDMLTTYLCKDIEITYLLKIGAIEYKLIVARTDYEKNLRKLEIIKEKINKKQKINLDTIEKKIKTEFKSKDKMAEEMSEDIDFAIELTSLELIDYDFIEELSMEYFKIQTLYNPIFDLEISNEKEKNYKKIEKNYKKGNIKKLHKLAEDYDENEIFQDEISNLKKYGEKYAEIKFNLTKQIRKIKNSFPYNQKIILDDDNLCRRKKDCLNKEIIEINMKNKAVENKIETLLKKSKI